MVPLSESPLLNLDTGSVHLIDTTNTDSLHALWSGMYILLATSFLRRLCPH
jgi:hypothetical protein